jgi:glycosyltransferase involved in cell wall biosynthesis/GT2 family glycosyltransferase
VTVWRSAGWWAALGKVRRKIAAAGKFRLAPLLECRPFSLWAGHRAFARPDPYDVWVRFNEGTIGPSARPRVQNLRKGQAPFFSVLMPTYNSSPELLSQAVGSVAGQSCLDWELIIADDGSSLRAHHDTMEYWRNRDRRIKLVYQARNGNISLATNAAAARAKGEYLVFLDHDDLLHSDALYHLALRLDAEPETDLIYTDDDKIGVDGKRHSPQFKPDWSPELLLSSCYVGHLKAVRVSLFRALGGMRVGFEGSQDHDFFLRAAERARAVVHIPQVLYHWRVHPGSTAADGRVKPRAFESGRRAVAEAFERRGIACEVVQPEWSLRDGCAIFEPLMPDNGPSVAMVIIASEKCSAANLLNSLGRTTYRNFKTFVVDRGGVPAKASFQGTSQYRICDLPGLETGAPLAEIRNEAARQVGQDLLLFVDQHLEVTDPRWLSQLVGWSGLPGVGAVGARVRGPDGRLAGAGYLLGFSDSLIGRAFENLAPGENGYLNLARVTRNCEALPADCLLTPRALFLQLGGFDANRFPNVFHDADYGLRLGEHGYRCVLSGEAELRLQSDSLPKRGVDPREQAEFRNRARGRDRYLSPHLNPSDVMFQIQPTVVPAVARSSPIRLLVVTHNLSWEGAPLIQLDLHSRLKEKGTVHPVILSAEAGPLLSRYEQHSIDVQTAPQFSADGWPPSVDGEHVMQLACWMKQQQFELLHANTARTYWAMAAARLAGVPAIWSIHESEPWPVLFPELSRRESARALACLDHPYRVVFASRGSKAVWRSLERIGNFTILPTPLDIPRFRAHLAQLDRAAARRFLELEDDETCVLSLGTVCARKGQHDLARAFAALPREAARRARCFVVGQRDDLTYSHELQRLSEQLPSDRRDRFTIAPETGQTAPYWKAADIFCCTSRIESYPRVILEAMECGLPIVSTPVFGISEQVVPGANALFYSPGDHRALSVHVTALIEDRPLRDDMARQSPWVLRGLFSHEDMIEQYERMFLAAVNSRPVASLNQGPAFQARSSPATLLSGLHQTAFKGALGCRRTRR